MSTAQRLYVRLLLAAMVGLLVGDLGHWVARLAAVAILIVCAGIEGVAFATRNDTPEES